MMRASITVSLPIARPTARAPDPERSGLTLGELPHHLNKVSAHNQASPMHPAWLLLAAKLAIELKPAITHLIKRYLEKR